MEEFVTQLQKYLVSLNDYKEHGFLYSDEDRIIHHNIENNLKRIFNRLVDERIMLNFERK